MSSPGESEALEPVPNSPNSWCIGSVPRRASHGPSGSTRCHSTPFVLVARRYLLKYYLRGLVTSKYSRRPGFHPLPAAGSVERIDATKFGLIRLCRLDVA
ncbi:hypothetical protein VTN49DRAFT_409 [Thermomyces lanuginosus]|uniref:uncharacterized protein n=1 Tax=Thermomyces lanuginosus TaxID=5541 RepID=UPI003743DCD7